MMCCPLSRTEPAPQIRERAQILASTPGQDSESVRDGRQRSPTARHEKKPHRTPLACAAVAAVRGALIAYSSDSTGDADHRSVDDFTALLREAFEVLRGAA